MRNTFVIFSLTFCALTSWAMEPTVHFSATQLFPGQTLRIEIRKVSPDSAVRITFLNKIYPAYTIGALEKRAFVGIPVQTLTQKATLTVHVNEKALPYQIKISTRPVPTGSVPLTASLKQLHQARLDVKESAQIGKALKYRSSEQRWEGSFLVPVEGAPESAFGAKRIYGGDTKNPKYHKGVDLSAPEGTLIRATNAGKVILTKPFQLHGNTVLIDHGQGIMSIYLHQKAYRVQPGQLVKRGDVIGEVGTTGLSTSPHLHFGVYVHGVAVNPYQWIQNEY